MSGKCNAKCRHCCFSCSPLNRTELTESEIWRIVDFGINSSDISEISISGGEPFLFEDLIYEIIKKVSDNGKTPTCITNAFWATEVDLTRQKLQKFYDAGLKFLTISFDNFHNEFIPIDNIKNVILASYQLDMRICINMAVTRNSDSINLLEELKDYLFGIPITRFSVMPVGEASNIESDEMYYCIDIDRELKCSDPSYTMVIHHDGILYPCCSPAVFDSILKIGSIRDYSLDDLRKKLYSNLLIYIIKKEGPGWFLKKLNEKGISTYNQKYVSTCHLCGVLFKDTYVVDTLKDEIFNYQKEKV